MYGEIKLETIFVYRNKVATTDPGSSPLGVPGSVVQAPLPRLVINTSCLYYPASWFQFSPSYLFACSSTFKG